MIGIKRIIDEDGASAIEYSLLAAFIAALITGSVTNIGQKVLSMFNSLSF